MFSFAQSTIGKKVIMAISGVILFGFAIGHMLGNLQIFSGPEKINAYAAFLKATTPLLWGTRIVLLVAVAAHIWSAVALTSRNADARPQPYAKLKSQASTYASRTMKWSGPIVGLFIVYHLLHFTVGFTSGQYAHSHEDVYSNVVSGFSVWWIAAFYIVAQLCLGLHLFHGAWSFLQSLGLNHPKYNSLRKQFATAVALVITLGNISIPLGVLSGQVKPIDQLELAAE